MLSSLSIKVEVGDLACYEDQMGQTSLSTYRQHQRARRAGLASCRRAYSSGSCRMADSPKRDPIVTGRGWVSYLECGNFQFAANVASKFKTKEALLGVTELEVLQITLRCASHTIWWINFKLKSFYSKKQKRPGKIWCSRKANPAWILDSALFTGPVSLCCQPSWLMVWLQRSVLRLNKGAQQVAGAWHQHTLALLEKCRGKYVAISCSCQWPAE